MNNTQAKAQEIARAYFELFNTPAGEKVLKHMRKETIENIAGDLDAMAPSIGVALALREGKRAQVKRIENMIEAGRNVK